jgi:acetyl-CoA carboxylase biotin carboxylase subunit
LFGKILIANRGEIALRVIRACKELGVETVAVHSEADVDSIHVKFADEDVCIGPSSSATSYLSIPRIIAAAEVTNADAIHPGYGFLAENPGFAEICESCGIKFIGPPADVIRKMGDKVYAKSIMKQAGVPVLPGSEDSVEDLAAALEVARNIGYPVLIKATLGGGGRGMRIAHSDEHVENFYQMARAEAQSAFGDPRIYIEKYLEHTRHIEFQILADRLGNVIHLGERECSIQRRYQKLVEESPSPVMTPETRHRLGKVVCEGAKAIYYESAGTMEFLRDGADNYYFMEMNTRIQVEHPVSELVTGVDLIKEQIRLAAGAPLSIKQDDVHLRGHAIECRINAEDPERGFTPNPGAVKGFHIPGGPGVRVDTHVYAGYSIPSHYDSMIGKLIVHGDTRDETIARMRRALEEFYVEGIKTTIPFHLQIVTDERFLSGNFDTGFVDGLNKLT